MSKNFIDYFLSLGVNCIIHINYDHKIDGDNLSKLFCKVFYSELLEGKSISDAYNKGILEIQKDNLTKDLCCCFHPHKENCLWHKKLNSEGIQKVN